MLKRLGKIYRGEPLATKNRKELLASIKKNYWKYIPPDTGDMPEVFH
jgi:hypothetical protein